MHNNIFHILDASATFYLDEYINIWQALVRVIKYALCVQIKLLGMF